MRSEPTRRAVCAGLLGLAAAGARAGSAAAEPGLDIMRRQRQLQQPKDEQETWTMRLISKNGALKLRRLVSYTLVDARDLAKILVRFLAPRDVEHTALLTWEAKDGDDDQWLYLPAVRKAKRIAASTKKSRFMGTDFAYEDLRRENLVLHHYALLESQAVDGQRCYVVEAIPATERQAADSGYSRRQIWIRQDTYSTIKEEYYDKQSALAKVKTSRNLLHVQGTRWRANEIEMRDVQAGTRTVVLVEARALDSGLSPALFTEAALVREGP